MKTLPLTLALISILIVSSGFFVCGLGVAQSPTQPPPTLNFGPSQDISGKTYSDDFSTNTNQWIYLGTAYRDATNKTLVLTQNTWDQRGVAFFNVPFINPSTANFSYKAGPYGDGFTLFFYKQLYTDIGWGGSLAFGTSKSYGVPGYGIEFDGWHNIGDPNATPPAENPDPSDSHVALIKDWVGTHLAYVNDARVKDNQWHNVSVVVGDNYVGVFVDGEFVLRWDGAIDRAYNLLGFSGGTGASTAWLLIDNFSLTGSALPLPSTSTHTSFPYPPPPRQPSYISISAQASLTVGSTVNVNGKITNSNGTGVGADKTVILSYSVGDGNWYSIGSAETKLESEYSVQWVPQASGTFSLKVQWQGDSTYFGASNTTTLHLLPYQDQKLFCVESNSTVTGLEFSSNNRTLAFIVSGASGTTGYTKVTFAKTLVADATAVVASIDGRTVNYDVSSSGDNWILTFSYSHSTHNVSIELGLQESETVATSPLSGSAEPLVPVGVVLVAVLVVAAVAFRMRKFGNAASKNQ